MKIPLIPYRYAQNLLHFFAKWLQLTPLKQWLSLLFMEMLLAAMPLLQLYQQYALYEYLNIARQQMQDNLQHQQKYYNPSGKKLTIPL